MNGFEGPFSPERPRVARIITRVLRDPAEAEEVADQVVVAFQRRCPASTDDSVSRLYRAALDAALSRVRKAGRSTGDSDPVYARLDGQQRAVRLTMGRLPRRSAGVLALRSSGMTYPQTAAVLGVAVRRVGRILRRAEVRLLREMSD